MQRSKRLLDEKFFEAGRLRDEAVAKGDQVADLRAQAADLNREIDGVKHQRAEMWREINRLKELNEAKTNEAADQHDKLKRLDYELSRTHARIEDTQRLVDTRSSDLRAKQCALEDTERELARTRDANARLSEDNNYLKRDNERVSGENYDLRKELDFTEGRNGDLSVQIRNAELRLREKEEALFATRRDVECQRVQQN